MANTSASHGEEQKEGNVPQENHHRRLEPIQGETIPADSCLACDGAANVMP